MKLMCYLVVVYMVEGAVNSSTKWRSTKLCLNLLLWENVTRVYIDWIDLDLDFIIYLDFKSIKSQLFLSYFSNKIFIAQKNYMSYTIKQTCKLSAIFPESLKVGILLKGFFLFLLFFLSSFSHYPFFYFYLKRKCLTFI